MSKNLVTLVYVGPVGLDYYWSQGSGIIVGYVWAQVAHS